MAEASCPKCENAITTVDEVAITTTLAGDVLLVCCPTCHAVLGAVKSRPVERAVEDVGRQAFDFLGKLTEKMGPK